MITEESILTWHGELDDDKEWIRSACAKLVAWLNESSEEESGEEDD